MIRKATIVVAMIAGLAALLVARPARALENCISVCDDAYCTVQHKHCVEFGPPPPAYGAIAYGSSSGAWGKSYHWGSQAEAERVAMQNCAQHGNDCAVMVWFEHKCGAVASGEGTAAFWALGDSENQARADAQNKCVQGGGKDCQVQVSQCSR